MADADTRAPMGEATVSGETLKPCPFCGASKARVYTVRAGEDVVDSYVQCRECYAQTDAVEAPFGEPESAIALWNQRGAEQTEGVEAIPICACDHFWPGQGHHSECPVRREIERLRATPAQQAERAPEVRCYCAMTGREGCPIHADATPPSQEPAPTPSKDDEDALQRALVKVYGKPGVPGWKDPRQEPAPEQAGEPDPRAAMWDAYLGPNDEPVHTRQQASAPELAP